MNDLSTDIKKLYGVGEVKAKAYARMGIRTVGELLEHYPRGYENRGDVILLSEADGIGKSAHVLTVATQPKSVRVKGRMSLLKFRAYDDSGACDITFFNQDFLKDTFPIGSVFRFYGKVEKIGLKYSLTSPAFEPYSEDAELQPLVPVYPLSEGLSQKQIAKDMRSALTISAYSGEEEDPLPSEIRRRHSLCLRSYAIRNIHSPDSFTALAAAKKRLIFDEFFVFALGLGLSSAKSAPMPAYPCREGDISRLLKLLPYELTNAQKRVIDEIRADMAKNTAMSRMVVGDVGCGKTVCAATAILIAVQSGRQAVMMAPTEILARQHYAELSSLFGALGIRCALLIGALGAAEKKRIHSSLASGETDVVIGTQALLSEGVSFARSGLIVTDEQHRFGVGQRALLTAKGDMTHTLVMSATPIPRSLALSIYGDLDVSRIDEMPRGRQVVDTYVVDESYRERLNGFIRKQISDGGQVYVVCPAVEENEDEETDLLLDDIDADGEIKEKGTPLKSAIAFAKELSDTFCDIRVEFLHGKMKSKEKDAVMNAFADGEVKILVSTTVIEVGVNVPNASLMIVENADRFGLSQLHQLRGRVGRGMRKSYCVLVSDAAKSEGKAHERLMTIKKSHDGYEIAERDLAMRGPGDFLRSSTDMGVRQSGGVKFKLAELCEDSGILTAAFDEARALLDIDPSLAEHTQLLNAVNALFTLEYGTVN